MVIYFKSVKSVLQAIAQDVYKTSIWKHKKKFFKLHQYIIYMQWWARKVNKDKILMQKKPHTPRNNECN